MAATSATEIPKSPYSVLFSIPGTKAFCASGALARLPMSMMSLGIILALNHLYDNWTIAGVMSAAYVLPRRRSRHCTHDCSTDSASARSDR